MKQLSPVKDTAQEKVLIKKRPLNASKYQKTVIEYAQKKANDLYQQAVTEKTEIYQIAYQQGYNDGIKQLLADFLICIDKSEDAFQNQVKQSSERLEALLVNFFSDMRVKEIVAHYFLLQQEKTRHHQIHLPANMQHIFSDQYPELTIESNSSSDTIALEFNNEICYFSPNIAAKNTLPQIFSVSSRCQLLKEHKANYQKFIELLSTHRGKHEPTDQ